MRILIIKFILTYLTIGTFILLNLLFNKNISLGKTNLKTGEFYPAPSWLLVLFSFYWIIIIPITLINRKKYEKE